MALPHQALVLVADGRKLLFLRNHGDENADRPAHRGARLARRPQGPRDQDRRGRDAPSRASATAGRRWTRPISTSRRKTAGPRTPPTSSRSARSRNDFEALAIIAPPKTLGVLRKELHKEVERRIVATLNKEMTDRPIPDIEDLLVGEAAPPA